MVNEGRVCKYCTEEMLAEDFIEGKFCPCCGSNNDGMIEDAKEKWLPINPCKDCGTIGQAYEFWNQGEYEQTVWCSKCKRIGLCVTKGTPFNRAIKWWNENNPKEENNEKENS